MPAPDPVQQPQYWDRVRLSGQYSPGLAVVREFRRKHKFDRKGGKGAQGVNMTYVGRTEPIAGQIEFYLRAGPNFAGGYYTDLQDWEQFSTLFLYDSTKAVQVNAITVEHPSLAMIGLSVVVCESISNPVQVMPGTAVYRVVVDLAEWAPPPPVSAVATPKVKPTAPAPIQPPGVPTDPTDAALQKQVAAALADAQRPL
jgi:hypothetical protein